VVYAVSSLVSFGFFLMVLAVFWLLSFSYRSFLMVLAVSWLLCFSFPRLLAVFWQVELCEVWVVDLRRDRPMNRMMKMKKLSDEWFSDDRQSHAGEICDEEVIHLSRSMRDQPRNQNSKREVAVYAPDRLLDEAAF
jgi:hypothetical protein